MLPTSPPALQHANFTTVAALLQRRSSLQCTEAEAHIQIQNPNFVAATGHYCHCQHAFCGTATLKLYSVFNRYLCPLMTVTMLVFMAVVL